MQVNCLNCNKSFEKLSHEIKRTNNRNFCCRSCRGKYYETKIEMMCGNCGAKISRYRKEAIKSKSNVCYCSSKCACTINMKTRKKSRRSKCEILLHELLVNAFPKLTILSNDKTMLDGMEVDIAIPTLSLAIEWNGIVHFKPIYGEEKLHQIQTRDDIKIKIANNKNINLIVVPDLVSTEKLVRKTFEEIKQHILNIS
jgi:hypothetical protein